MMYLVHCCCRFPANDCLLALPTAPLSVAFVYDARLLLYVVIMRLCVSSHCYACC